MKDVTSESLGGVATEVIACLVDFTNNIVLAGMIPEEVRPVFYGANLVALSKKDNDFPQAKTVVLVHLSCY